MISFTKIFMILHFFSFEDNEVEFIEWKELKWVGKKPQCTWTGVGESFKRIVSTCEFKKSCQWMSTLMSMEATEWKTVFKTKNFANLHAQVEIRKVIDLFIIICMQIRSTGKRVTLFSCYYCSWKNYCLFLLLNARNFPRKCSMLNNNLSHVYLRSKKKREEPNK